MFKEKKAIAITVFCVYYIQSIHTYRNGIWVYESIDSNKHCRFSCQFRLFTILVVCTRQSLCRAWRGFSLILYALSLYPNQQGVYTHTHIYIYIYTTNILIKRSYFHWFCVRIISIQSILDSHYWTQSQLSCISCLNLPRQLWSQTQTNRMHWTHRNTTVISGACLCCHVDNIKASCDVHKMR